MGEKGRTVAQDVQLLGGRKYMEDVRKTEKRKMCVCVCVCGKSEESVAMREKPFVMTHLRLTYVTAN